jgi:hypothetical protein
MVRAMRHLVVLVLAACGHIANHEPDASTDAHVDASVDAPSCVPSPTSVRARWRADGNTNDDTGAFAGTAVGTIGFTPGKHGMAFAFDGVNNAITADPTDQLYPAGSFSVELWMKTPRAPAAEVGLIQKYDCGGADACGAPDWEVFLSQLGLVQFNIRVGGGPSSTVTASTSEVTDDNWHHVVGVRDVTAKQQLLYIDGALAVSAPLGDNFIGAMTNADGVPDPLTIAASRASGTNALTMGYAGAIDEPAYYLSALSATEIAEIYAAPQGICP